MGREGVWKGKRGKGRERSQEWEREERRGVKIDKGSGKKWENMRSGRGKGKVKRRTSKEKRT